MLISPSKIKKNKIIKDRTLNFETVKRTHGNMIIIPTLDKTILTSVVKSNLFRPMQIMSMYVPRKIIPRGRTPIITDQKEYYKEIKTLTNNKIKFGKRDVNMYGGKNLVYDIGPGYKANLNVLNIRFHHGIAILSALEKYLESEVKAISSDSDYTNSYIIFPLSAYIDDFVSKVKVKKVTDDCLEPLIIFLKALKDGSIDKTAYAKVQRIIFYNPNAKAMVVIDLSDPDIDKDFLAVLQKISRLNNFNNTANPDTLEDIIDDDDEEDIDDEDQAENIKDKIKNIILGHVADALHAKNLTDFEAANRDEKDLIIAIDNKIDDYLSDPENLKKPFAELVSGIETDKEIKSKAVRYVETKKMSQQKIDNSSINLDKENEILGNLSDIDNTDIKNEPDVFDVDVQSMDERIKTSHLSSIDEEYNKKQYRKDVIDSITGFSNSDYLPLTLDKYEIEDTSDDFNEKETVHIKYKTDEGKPLSFKLDIPKVIDKRYFYLSGNKKILSKQITRLPIVKTKADRVEITTSFNKMTIERSTGKLSRKNSYLFKVLKNIKLNPNITVEYGSNGIVNSNTKYDNDFEYEEISDSITRITAPGYFLNFNREDLEEDIETYNIPENFLAHRTPLGYTLISGKNKTLLYIGTDGTVKSYNLESGEILEINDSLPKFILSDVLKTDADITLPTIGKSFIYTTLKFLATTYPLFTVLGAMNGITDIMKRYNIEHFFSDTQTKGKSLDYVEVVFSDKYMYYKDTIKNTILLNPLYMMNTKDYRYSDFDVELPYTDFFKAKFGSSVGIYIRNTLRINLNAMMDPISREVLKDMKLPTDIIDLLLIANDMLISNNYKAQNDMRNYRIRTTEVVPAMMYKIIADAYINYQKHKMNGRPINIEVNPTKLMSELLTLQTCNDFSTLNPVLECENIATATEKGFRGINLNKAYTLELRAYDKSMNGIVSGNATPYSGQAGIVRSLSYDPKINTIRGYIPDIDESELSATNILSPTELLSAFTSVAADPPRQAMQVAQTKHTMPVASSSKQLIGSGMSKTMAFMISDDFCFKAKQDGIVENIDDATHFAILKYVDGTKDAIDLSDVLSKNSNSGFYIKQNFIVVYKINESFKKGDVIAYNPSYFKGKGKNIDYCPGTLSKVAIASGDFAFEDSTMISETLSKKCQAKVTMMKPIILGPNTIIHHCMDVGDDVITNDHLLDFTSVATGEDSSDFLAYLADKIGSENMSDVTQEAVRSKYSGKLVDIKIFYNVDFSTLSPSLQKLIRKYRQRIEGRRKKLLDEGITTTNIHIPPLEQIKNDKIGPDKFEGVLIQFSVEYTTDMGEGDKLTYSTALKGVVSKRLKVEESPISEYREENIIEAVLTPTGVISRMTSDVYRLLYSNKVLVEVGKQIKEIVDGKR